MLISLIIPCYNAGQYIKRTLDSIVYQDLSDVEIILINDGSVDNTLFIINSYANRFSNISILSQNNMGVSAARNRGIQEARGDYICFVDADDVVTSTYIENLKENILKGEFDIVCFGFKYFKTKTNIVDCYPGIRIKTLLYDFLVNRVRFTVFSVLYRKLFLVKYNIKFDESTYYGEDTEFLIKVFTHIEKENICMCNNILYYYLYNSSSAMHQSGYSLKKFTTVLSSFRSIEYIKQHISDTKIINAIYNKTLYKIITGYRMSNGGELFDKYKGMLKKYPPFSCSLLYIYNIIFVTKNKIFLR